VFCYCCWQFRNISLRHYGKSPINVTSSRIPFVTSRWAWSLSRWRRAPWCWRYSFSKPCCWGWWRCHGNTCVAMTTTTTTACLVIILSSSSDGNVLQRTGDRPTHSLMTSLKRVLHNSVMLLCLTSAPDSLKPTFNKTADGIRAKMAKRTWKSRWKLNSVNYLSIILLIYQTL